MYKTKITEWSLGKYTKNRDHGATTHTSTSARVPPTAAGLRRHGADGASSQQAFVNRNGGARAMIHPIQQNGRAQMPGRGTENMQYTLMFAGPAKSIADLEASYLVRKLLYHSEAALTKFFEIRRGEATSRSADSTTDGLYVFSSSKWLEMIGLGVQSFLKGDVDGGGRYVQYGFHLLHASFQPGIRNMPVDVVALVEGLECWRRSDRPEIAAMVLRYIAQLCAHYLDPSDPDYVMIETLVRVQDAESGWPLLEPLRGMLKVSLPRLVLTFHSEPFHWADPANSDTRPMQIPSQAPGEDSNEQATRMYDSVGWCVLLAYWSEQHATAESLLSRYLARAAPRSTDAVILVLKAFFEARLGKQEACVASLQQAHEMFLAHQPTLDEACLHLGQWREALDWLRSFSSGDASVVDLQVLLRDHEQTKEVLTQREMQVVCKR